MAITKPMTICAAAGERWHVDNSGVDEGQDILIRDENRLVVASLPHAYEDSDEPSQLATAELLAAGPELRDVLADLYLWALRCRELVSAVAGTDPAAPAPAELQAATDLLTRLTEATTALSNPCLSCALPLDADGECPSCSEIADARANPGDES